MLGLRIATRPNDERRIELPEAFATPREDAPAAGTTAFQPGLHAVAVHDDGRGAIAFAWLDGAALACAVTDGADARVIDITAMLDGAAPMAAAFACDGRGIWLSTERSDRGSVMRFASLDFDSRGRASFEPPPLPAHHELFAHPSRDEALLLMACGQDGTFARVARATEDAVESVTNRREAGGEPAGWAGWNADGLGLCLVGDSGVETLGWPTLERRASAAAPEGLVFNYSGLQFDDCVLASASDEETEDQRFAAVYDAASLAERDVAPAPKGMWAGHFGDDLLVTVDSGDKATRAVRIHRLSWHGAQRA